MNLQEFEFLGFYEVLSVILIGVISVSGISLAFYTYSSYQSISNFSKIVLILLRSSIFILLVFLLMNPVFKHTVTTEEKPELVILFDQSSSVSISKGNWNGSLNLPRLTLDINNNLSQEFDLRWVGFDSDTYEIDIADSMSFTGSQTDIGLALSNVVSNYTPNQILLITDGVTTRGRDPLFVAQNLDIPINSLAIGDSTRFKDLVVSFVEYSSEMVTETEYTVRVGIRNDGFLGSKSRVTLNRDGLEIASQDVIFQYETGIQQVDFNLSSSSEGLYDYTVSVEPFETEWSTENNVYNFSVNYVDSRLEILYMTYQHHPDVSIVKQILFEYPEISITELTWNGTRFLQNLNQLNTTDFDLIVIHGVPNSSNTSELVRLRTLISEHNTVLFMIPGTTTDPVYPSILSTLNSFQADGNSMSWTQSQIQPQSAQSGHPVLDLPTYNWSRSPLVTSLYSGLAVRSGNQSLMISPQYESIPAVSTQRIGNYRSTVLSISGFGSFYLSGNDDDRETISDLIGNIITWSASDVNQDLFQLTSNKSEYSARENIIFNASVRTEDGSPEENAIVDLMIENDNSETRNFSLQNTQNGNFTLSVASLPVGTYEFSGSARRNDFNIGTVTGSFTVGSSQQELVNTIRQDNLLNQLSSLTHGISYDYSEVDALISELKSRSNKTTVNKTDMLNVFKNPLWFVVVILLLTIEWFLRRKYLLP